MIFNADNCKEKAQNIKAILFDVDGVLTDGGIIYDDSGLEYKKYNVKDGQIISHLKRLGFIVGAITGRESDVVKNRCSELKLDFHRHGVKDKLVEYENFKKEYKLKDEQIAYIGDDIIDLSILVRCGLSVTPSDAREYMKKEVDMVTTSKGGEGVFRDVADFILESQNLLEELLNSSKKGRFMNSEELYKKLKERKFILSGPCVIENESMIMYLAENIKKLTEDLGFTYIFKASFDKANRTSLSSYRGPGIEEGLRILERVKKEFNLPLTTDIHDASQAKALGEVIDIIQIPAFLCRQTDLLIAAAKTNRIINIKKAQFLDGKDMIHPVNKVKESGNNKIMLTERGSMFGLGNLVVDFRQIIDMKEFGYPVIMDVTHSTQKPSALGGTSGGDRKYAPYMAKLANAVGVDGFFFEVHENPEEALSDGPNMVYLKDFRDILESIK